MTSPCRRVQSARAFGTTRRSQSLSLPRTLFKKINESYRIIAWFGLEGALKIILFHPAISRDIFPQPRVLRAPSSLASSPTREGAATASPGNLGQGFTTLMGKNFFPIFNLNLPSVSLEPFPLVLSLHTLVTSPSPSFL